MTENSWAAGSIKKLLNVIIIAVKQWIHTHALIACANDYGQISLFLTK